MSVRLKGEHLQLVVDVRWFGVRRPPRRDEAKRDVKMLREPTVLQKERRHDLAIVAPFAGGGCVAADALGVKC
jgi:hypothetical protein